MDYGTLRHFADSWMLLALVVIFVSIVIWSFRPGGSKSYDDAAGIPFHDEKDRSSKNNSASSGGE